MSELFQERLTGNLVGVMIECADSGMACALCGGEMEWTECYDCGGDGGHDGYELDPLWYQPGDMVPCAACNSRGGSWYCTTNSCPTFEGWKVIRNIQLREKSSK